MIAMPDIRNQQPLMNCKEIYSQHKYVERSILENETPHCRQTHKMFNSISWARHAVAVQCSGSWEEDEQLHFCVRVRPTV